MKNNKGYYSWIHSMKNAALQAQTKGQKMLNEEKAKKKPFTGIPEIPQPKKVENTDPLADINPETYNRMVIQGLQQMGGLEPTEQQRFEVELAAKDKEHLDFIANASTDDLKPPSSDLNYDGDVDGEDAGEFSKDVEMDLETIPGGKLPTYKLAADARAETEELAKKAEEEDWEDSEDVRHLSIPMGTHGWKNVRESISSKISRMLNED